MDEVKEWGCETWHHDGKSGSNSQCHHHHTCLETKHILHTCMHKTADYTKIHISQIMLYSKQHQTAGDHISKSKTGTQFNNNKNLT